jgi:rhodanese-related sulfurtransferase
MFAFLMGLKSVTPQELQQLVQARHACVLDVNARQSWLKARVPGALHLSPDYQASDLPGDKAATLVFYCSNVMCRKAPNAARRAKSLGYGDVRVMSAGISGWLAAQLPTQSGECA